MAADWGAVADEVDEGFGGAAADAFGGDVHFAAGAGEFGGVGEGCLIEAADAFSGARFAGFDGCVFAGECGECGIEDAAGDGEGEVAGGDAELEGGEFAALVEVDGLEFGAGLDVAFDDAAACGDEAGLGEGDFDVGAHLAEGGDEDAFDEFEGWCEGVVGAAFEAEGGWGGGVEECGEEGLEEEGGAACGADGELVRCAP